MGNNYEYILASFLLGVITNHLITTYCYSNLYEGADEDDGDNGDENKDEGTSSNISIWIIGGIIILLILGYICYEHFSKGGDELTDADVINDSSYTGRGDFEVKMESLHNKELDL